MDLAYSLLEAGFSIGYSKDIRVTHRFRHNEKWDLLKNCVNRRFDPLLHYKHRRLYRHHIGTPWTPMVMAMMLAHTALLLSGMAFHGAAVPALLIALVLAISGALRRAGMPWRCGGAAWIRELVSCSISPLVLLGALVYGSVRFRHLLVI